MILAAILSAIALAFGGFKASQIIRKESTTVTKYFEDEVLELGIQPHIVRKTFLIDFEQKRIFDKH